MAPKKGKKNSKKKKTFITAAKAAGIITGAGLLLHHGLKRYFTMPYERGGARPIGVGIIEDFNDMTPSEEWEQAGIEMRLPTFSELRRQ